MKIHFPLLLLGSLIWIFSFQSCTQPSTSDTAETEASIEEATDTTSTTKAKGLGEMTVQEQSDYATTHAEHFSFVDKKMVEITNENVQKKDHFTFECGSTKTSLERHYNDNNEIHLLSYTQCDENNCSTKHHFFWEDKLIYQFYHHEIEKDGKLIVDDHKTFFKDGKMIQCLEKKYSYVNGEAQPNPPYDHVNCVPLDKLTGDIEKLLTLSEEEAKAYLCK